MKRSFKWWVLRLLFGLIALFSVQLAVKADKSLKGYEPMGGLQEEFVGDWISADRLPEDLLKIAEGANVGTRPGYLHAWLDRLFIPNETRLALGLQRWRNAGLRKNTTPSEFALLVFGSRYSQELERLHQEGVLDNATYLEILQSANEILEKDRQRS